MTGFLGRLARRAVPSAAGESSAPSLEPMSATSAFSPELEASFGFVEEHIERVAQPPTAAEPSVPPSESQPIAGSEHPPAPLVRTPSPSNELAPQPPPSPPQPASVAPPAPANAAVARSDDRPATAEPNEVEARVVAAQPTIQRVIEINEAPGPVVPVVRRVTVPAADQRDQPAAEHPPLVSTTVAEPEPTVVFVPGEPLGRMGLEPLQPDELLTRPEVAEAVERNRTVHVHIGRLDVARPAPAPPTPPPARPEPNLLSLDDYLKERSAAVGRGGR